MRKTLRGINKVIRVLIVATFFHNWAFSSFAPIIAVFVTSEIAGGSARVAGFSAAAFWISKSLIQLFVARHLDRLNSKDADFAALFGGYLVSGVTVFGYLFAAAPVHLYLIAAVHGLSMAWAVPAWQRMFTRHVDRWEIGFEWSLESVFSVGLSTAAAAALGGYLAEEYGFGTLFLAAGIIGVSSAFLLFFLRDSLLQAARPRRAYPEAHPHH